MKPKPKSIHPYQDIRTIQGASQCFSWWLVHCYLYYRYNNPIISDRDFDTLTGWVKVSWDVIDHMHKHLVTIDDLNAGSGFAIDYPLRVEGAAMMVLREIQNDSARQAPVPKRINPAVKTHTKQPNTFSEYDTLFT